MQIPPDQWLLALFCVVCLVAFVSGTVLVRLVRNARRAKVISNWRGVYHNVPAVSIG